MKKLLSTLALGSALVLTLAACGTTGGGEASSSSASGDVPQEILDLVTSANEVQTWTGPTDGPTAVTGKKIVSIPCSMAATGCARWDEGIHAAGEELGWTVETIDPAFDPQKANDAIQQAINMKADGVVFISIEPALLANSIAAAREAGLVVVSAGNGWEDEKLDATTIQKDVSPQGFKQGQWAGAQACADAGGKGDVLLIDDPEFRLVSQRIAGAADSLAKCSKMTVTTQQVAAADIGSTLQQKAAALLQANPNVTSVVIGADAFATDFLVAIRQLGLQDKVRVYSEDGNADIIQDIVDGGATKGTVGVSLEQQGWATLDAVNRLLQGKTVAANDGVQIRMVSSNFIPKGNIYKGDFDFESAYKSLWSTGAFKG